MRQPGQHVFRRRQILAPPIEPAGQRIGRRCGRFLLQPVEHLEVLPLDDRPVVLLAEELPAVAAQRACQPAVLFDGLERADELAVRLVVEPGVAAEALALQDVALAVGQHRPSERPRFERDHRQALVVRRHDQQIRGGHRVELVRVVEEAEVPDARMLRHRQQRVADQDERQLAGRILQIALKELEELLAALVLVDAADIHGKRPADLVLLAEPRRLRVVRARPTRCRRRRPGRR